MYVLYQFGPCESGKMEKHEHHGIWMGLQMAGLSIKRMQPSPKQDENSVALSTVVQSDEAIIDAKSLTVQSGSP